jgi:hypothetical protein
MQIQKHWAVGDKLFDSYADARIYMVSRRSELQRDLLVYILAENIGASAEIPLADIADAILAKFKITPRKP